MAHHIVQHAAALQIAAPKPGFVWAAVLLGCARQIRPAGAGNGAVPNNFPPRLDGWREKLIFKIAVTKSGAFDKIDNPLGLSDISRERFLASDALQ